MREFLKRFGLLRRAVYKARDIRDKLKKQWRMFKAMCDPLRANMELYERNHGVMPDFKNPRNFNEKCMWLLHNVYGSEPLVTRCADKYEMRGYVEEKGLGSILPKVYGVWDKPKQVPWESFPEKFVVKCNHGCGCNVICTDKSALDIKKANRDLRRWLKINYANYYGEINYKNIKPRIFCEEFLDEGTGDQPIDWKFICLNGEPRVLMVCTERATGTAKFMFTDMEYNRIPCEIGHHAGGTLPPKPDTLEEMISAARTLSQDFPMVRVDFYSIGGKAYLGEMTFSPLGCAIDYIDDETLLKMGDMLDISAYNTNLQ